MILADTHNFSVVKNPPFPPQTLHEAFIASIEHTTEVNGLYHSSVKCWRNNMLETNSTCLSLPVLKQSFNRALIFDVGVTRFIEMNL